MQNNRKTILQTGIYAFLLIALALAACESSPPPSPNDRLFTAVYNRNLSSVRLALADRANINAKNNYGATALLYAVGRYANLEIVRYLVENGADINARDNNDNTALIIAADFNQTAIAQYLIDRGTNVNARNRTGKSALNYAYEKGEMGLYDYLIAHGAREFEPNPVAQPAAPSSSATNVYVQPSAPTAPASTPTPAAPSFQTGTYAWSNSGQNMTMNLSAGIVTAQLNYRPIWTGTYRINGSQIVITVLNASGDYARLRGQTYSYTITSTTSFTGSGETWVRTGY